MRAVAIFVEGAKYQSHNGVLRLVVGWVNHVSTFVQLLF